ncbi:MAG: hypothetical protein R2772_08790 [Chitinophagales bacterium]
MKNIFLSLMLLFVFTSAYAQRAGLDRGGAVSVEPLFQDLMQPDAGGVFRGVYFDWSKSKVKDFELTRSTSSLYKEDVETELVITTDMGADIMNFADITYTFDEKGLYHIKVESYATSKQAADDVYNKVVAFFTKKLGAGVLADDGYLEFKGKSGSYNYVVALENIEYEDSPGMYMYIYVN